MAAAGHVDDEGPLGQGGESPGIEDTPGGGGQRQQADQDIGPIEKRREAVGTVKGLDSVDRPRRAAPAQHVKAEGLELAPRILPEDADAKHADPAILGPVEGQLLPPPFALKALVEVHVPVVAQHVIDRILAHLGGEALIDHAHDRHAFGQLRVPQDVVDTGGQREDRLQIGIAFEIAGRGLPHQGELDVGGLAHLGPHPDLELGLLGLDAPGPFARVVPRALEQNGQG